MVKAATLTSASSLPANGSDNDPNGDRPTLAELLLLRSENVSCTALAKAIVRRPAKPSLAQTTVTSTWACASAVG